MNFIAGRTGGGRLIGVVALVALIAAACGPNVDIDATIDARVQVALEAVSTATPQPTPTLSPSATPQVLPTPLPTATPAPTVTPAPTSTAPPTPVQPTPAPTVTPQPTATPPPTATAQSEALATPTAIAIPSDLYADIRLSVVKIRSGNSFGSGWAIEDGWIITNQHVVAGASTVTVEIPLPGGGVQSKTGTVRGVDTKRDLAAVQVDHGAPVLPTRVVLALDAGTPIIQMGYSVDSTGGFPVIHTGIITTVVRHLGVVLDDANERADQGDDTGGVGIVIFDANADPGDSGGPVLDLQGNVVGITFGAVVSTSGGKRVTGQQMATAIESIERVWTQMRDGTNTTSL